jgi:hypothetical protein
MSLMIGSRDIRETKRLAFTAFYATGKVLAKHLCCFLSCSAAVFVGDQEGCGCLLGVIMDKHYDT